MMEKQNNTTLLADVLVSLLLVWIIFLGYRNDGFGSLFFRSAIVMVGSYFLSRLMIEWLEGKIALLCLWLLILLTCIETVIGYYQLFFLHKQTAGSFGISVLLACFLSVGICLSLACYLFTNHDLRIRKVALYVGIFGCTIIPATGSRSAILAICIVSFLFLLNTERGRSFIKKRWIVISVLFMIGCISLYVIKRPSADGRMLMNKINVQRIIKGGLTGTGMNGYAGSYASAQADYFERQMKNSDNDIDWHKLNESERKVADCPSAAFNEFLQIGVQTGPISMLLFLIFLLIAVIYSYKKNSIWCFGLIPLVVFSLFSYPLHYVEFQILFSVITALCITSQRNKYSMAFCLPSLICTLIVGVNYLANSMKNNSFDAEWRNVYSLYENEYYEMVVDCIEHNGMPATNSKQFFIYGRSLNMSGQYFKSDSVLMAGINISGDPMFWNVMGNNSIELGNYREAEKRYKHAFYMVPNRLYPLYLLAKLYYVEGDSVRFYNMSETVESFIPKVESASTELLRLEIREMK